MGIGKLSTGDCHDHCMERNCEFLSNSRMAREAEEDKEDDEGNDMKD